MGIHSSYCGCPQPVGRHKGCQRRLYPTKDQRGRHGTPPCAAGPPGLCVIAEPAKADDLHGLRSDGRPRAGFTATDIDSKSDYLWDLSPDGRRITVVKKLGTYSATESQATEGPIQRYLFGAPGDV